MKEFSVLFVDDDINVLSALKRGLIDEEYKAFFAASGDKALTIMEENEISVIVSDMRMPGMDGLQLLKKIKDKYPDTIKIVLSGYTQLPQILATINQVDIFKFITKPWDLEDELKPIIRQAVDYYNYLKEKEKQKEALEKRNILYQNILRSTDEKFLQSKSDFENIKEISKYIFNTVKVQAEGKKDWEMINTVCFIEELYLEYLKVFPTNIIDFKPERLEADLSKWLSKQKLNIRVDFKKKNNASIKLKGNYILIYYIVTTLVKQLSSYMEEKGLDLAIDSIDGNLIIFMTAGEINSHLQTAFRDRTNNDILISFLKAICKTINWTMVIQMYNESLYAELKIPVQPVYGE